MLFRSPIDFLSAVTQKVNRLKKVKGIFKRIKRFKPKVYKSAHDGNEKIFRIEGQKGYDNITLFNEAESKIINLYKRKKKPIKTTLHLTNEYIMKDPARGTVVDKMEQHFHSKAEVINETTNIEEKYRDVRDIILEKAISFIGYIYYGLVYKVTCAHDGCGEFYIGETGRRLQERIKDHNARDKSSSLCKHALETGHPPVNIEQFLVLNDGLNNYKKRKLSEALFIKEQKPTLNEQGQSIPLTLLN